MSCTPRSLALRCPRNQGFFCPECPKLFPVAPPPQTSPVPGTKRSLPKRVTKRSILQERKDKIKRGLANAVRSTAAGGIRIRGKWISTREFECCKNAKIVADIFCSNTEARRQRSRHRASVRWVARNRLRGHHEHSADRFWDFPAVP